VRLEFHDGKKIENHPESLIRRFEFNISDVTNFGEHLKVIALFFWDSARTNDAAIVTKSGPLILHKGQESPKLEVKVEVFTRWIAEEDRRRTASESLAQMIVGSPIPSSWEARRNPAGDVYFFNLEENKATACLWWDPIPDELRTDP
jgi:hypothetical protein